LHILLKYANSELSLFKISFIQNHNSKSKQARYYSTLQNKPRQNRNRTSTERTMNKNRSKNTSNIFVFEFFICSCSFLALCWFCSFFVPVLFLFLSRLVLRRTVRERRMAKLVFICFFLILNDFKDER